MKTHRFDEIKRSTPEQDAVHQRWAKLTLNGATLRELRELKGKTQAGIGAALGVSQVQAGRIEAGGDEMQLSTVRRYLEALGLELDGLQVRDRERDYLVVTVRLPGAEQAQQSAGATSTHKASGGTIREKTSAASGTVRERNANTSGGIYAKTTSRGAKVRRQRAKRGT
jgi:transcriptional regulator with XRE-family HTH domain